jgi:hypothetical protein
LIWGWHREKWYSHVLGIYVKKPDHAACYCT